MGDAPRGQEIEAGMGLCGWGVKVGVVFTGVYVVAGRCPCGVGVHCGALW